MGIHDRDYYRQSTPFGRLAEWGLYELTPVVKWLIIANVAVFLLQIFVVREVHMTWLEVMRKTNPDLDKKLKEKEDDPQGIAEIKKEYGLDKLEEKGPHRLYEPKERIS